MFRIVTEQPLHEADDTKGVANNGSAESGAVDPGSATHENDHDWVNLINWDDNDAGPESLDFSGEDGHHPIGGVSLQINSNVAIQLPLSTPPSPTYVNDYTRDNLLRDVHRFINEGTVIPDRPITDYAHLERVFESTANLIPEGLFGSFWVCIDISPNKDFLSRCKQCTAGKRYNACCNAAAHLRRAHFNPKKGGKSKVANKDRAEFPSMDECRLWMQEFREEIPQQAQQYNGDDLDTGDPIVNNARSSAKIHRRKARRRQTAEETTTLEHTEPPSDVFGLYQEDRVPSYVGISNIIQGLSGYSADHKHEVLRVFQDSAASRPESYILSDPTEPPHWMWLPGFLLDKEGNTWTIGDQRNVIGSSTGTVSTREVTEMLEAALDQPLGMPSAESLTTLISMDGTDRFGYTLLHLASHLGASYTLLGAIMTADNVHKVASGGETFMHLLDPWTIGDDMPRLMQTLKDWGFSFSRRDYRGENSIHALFRRGATLEQLSSHAYLLKGKSALHHHMVLDDPLGCEKAIANGHEDLGTLWRELKDSACRSPQGYECLCRKLGTWDINDFDCAGETTLMKAARENNFGVSQDYYEGLLDEGADIHNRNYRMETPLHLAVRSGNLKATKALLKHKANVHTRDFYGRGILESAEAARGVYKSLYECIAACMAMVVDAGAVRNPTVFQEWGMGDD
ncbi:MAG: hypothetical protein Q9218_003567 [Villophora microphyllina]